MRVVLKRNGRNATPVLAIVQGVFGDSSLAIMCDRSVRVREVQRFFVVGVVREADDSATSGSQPARGGTLAPASEDYKGGDALLHSEDEFIK